MKEPYPSCPTRPPITCLYFTGYTDGEEEYFEAYTYAELYSARRWLDIIFEEYPDQNWQDENTLVLTLDNHTLKIKSYNLEDVIEYEPTKEEKNWQPGILNRIIYFWKKPEKKAPPVQTAEKTPRPPRNIKPPAKGMITVAQIAEEYGLSANKARNILRKAKMSKPKEGWTFKKGDKTLDKIHKLFKKNS